MILSYRVADTYKIHAQDCSSHFIVLIQHIKLPVNTTGEEAGLLLEEEEAGTFSEEEEVGTLLEEEKDGES